MQTKYFLINESRARRRIRLRKSGTIDIFQRRATSKEMKCYIPSNTNGSYDEMATTICEKFQTEQTHIFRIPILFRVFYAIEPFQR